MSKTKNEQQNKDRLDQQSLAMSRPQAKNQESSLGTKSNRNSTSNNEMRRRMIEEATSQARRSSIDRQTHNQLSNDVSEEWRDEERAENSSTASSFLQAAAIPPRLVSQETTPGAVFVPGVLGSYDDSQHDNLLDMEDETNDGIIRELSSDMNSSLPSLRRGPGSTVQSPLPTLSTSIPVVAELAPSHRYSEQEVEDRLAERLEAQLEVQISQRFQEEVDRRFSMDKRQHAIAEVTRRINGIDSKNTARGKEEENFKICGCRRSWWGLIICVIMLLIFGGMCATYLWYNSRAREYIANKTRPSTDNDVKLGTRTTTPTITPMLLNPSTTEILSTPQPTPLVDSAAIP